MKQKLKFSSVAATIVACIAVCMMLAGCSGSYKIKMTTETDKVNFYLRGSGVATVDWGDGSEKVSLTLNEEDVVEFEHTYPYASIRTITVNGENITILDCRDILLTTLDVSKNTALTHLDCSDNKLTNLDVSKNTVLTYLDCDFNQLTTLDVSKNIAMIYLSCGYNSLTSLDVSKNNVLSLLMCPNNKFTTEGLNALFGTLPRNPIIEDKEIILHGMPGLELCDKSIAELKGWSVVTEY